jgi:hypothetical protein
VTIAACEWIADWRCCSPRTGGLDPVTVSLWGVHRPAIPAQKGEIL